MTLGIFKIGLKSSRKEKKNYKSFVFSFGSSSWSARRLLGYLFGSKQKSAFFFSIFWCYTIGKFVLQVGNVSSLDIWGFLRFVLGDLVYFCEVFSSCNLHLGVFVRLMPFGHFVNSFGDSGRN